MARRAITFWDAASQPASVSNAKLVLLYQEALVRMCDQVKKAILAGSLSPRDDLVGLRIAAPEFQDFSSWHLAHSQGERINSPSVDAELVQSVLRDDVDLFPHVLVNLSEFCGWAESEGIAEPGEVDRLLNEVRGDAQPNGKHANEPPWKAKARAYADEIYQHDKAMGCEPSKESIAKDIAKRFDEEGIRGRNGRLDGAYIRRHALTDWQKPHRRF